MKSDDIIKIMVETRCEDENFAFMVQMESYSETKNFWSLVIRK